MNDGLGFFFFVLAPLFGLWGVGCVAGLAILGLRHAILRKLPPDYVYYFLNGMALSAAAVQVGFLLVLHHGRDTEACIRYAWGGGILSAVAWIPSAALASLSGLGRARKWTFVITALVCLVLAGLIIFRISQNMSHAGG